MLSSGEKRADRALFSVLGKDRMLPKSDIPEPLAGLLALWEERRRARRMPTRADLPTEDLRPWLGHLILLDVLANGADFRYRVYGTRLVDTFGVERTGATVGMLPAETRGLALAEYATAYHEGRPRFVCFHRTIGTDSLPVAKLILPLSDDGQTANMLLAGVYLLTAVRHR